MYILDDILGIDANLPSQRSKALKIGLHSDFPKAIVLAIEGGRFTGS